MDENLYIRIEDYLDGLLSADERQAFEAEVRDNPAAAQALATVQEARERMRRHWNTEVADAALRATLQDVGKAYFKSEAGSSSGGARIFQLPRTAWAAAAALALLVTAWFFLRPPAHERLYADYRSFPPADFTLRGDAPAAPDAAAAFNAGNYQQALEQLQQRLAAQPDDLEAQFFAALCQLELKNYAAATAAFQAISAGASAWSDEARWYLALSHLRSNDPAKCAEVLRQIPDTSSHYAEAQALLKKL